ncbi:hypothetical protein JJC04_01480 [Flavobacterium covae]|nr:hypothetical protein [Flavobacterium covae]QYS91509.1 hypothetical protein JJC04_01480 [Flavobacterium covae]
MNTTELTSLLKTPNIITHSQCSELESVLKEYPYFQSARSLYLKGLHIQDSFKYNAALKLTAAHTTDRTILFDFITNKNFAQERNFEVITPTIHSKFSSSDKINEAIESVSQINEAYTKEELELTKKNTSSNDSINLETEIQNSNVTDEEKLEQSVLNSIIIANETIEDSNNNTITEESISLENPLEKSILSSISESDQSINNKIEIPSSHTPSIREKVSWLEDIIDLDQKHEIEINLSEPIILNDNKTLSFQEWLLLSKTTPIERPENIITVEKEEPITKPAEENITNKISISDTISKNSTTNEISNTTNKKKILK